MAAWAGFSDDDLQKMRLQDPNKKVASDKDGTGGLKKSVAGTSKPRPQRAVPPMKIPSMPAASISPDIAPEARLVPLRQQKSNEVLSTVTADSSSNAVIPIGMTAPLKETSTDNVSSTSKSNDTSIELLSEADGMSREMGNLENFRVQQQMMEELNKKKKQMLTTAIAARQKKTTAETKKLLRIQAELSHLDQLLTVDVSILRDKIEECARDFADAQRRYDLAEKEFINSKLDLHKKGTMKEQLTEHLYTIIHQNELRKAKKLAELMEKLELEEAEVVAAGIGSAAVGIDSSSASIPSVLFMDCSTTGVGLLKPSPSVPVPTASASPLAISSPSPVGTGQSDASSSLASSSDVSATVTTVAADIAVTTVAPRSSLTPV